MPYQIVRNDSRCDSVEYAVVKEDDGKLMGCHSSRQDAVDQMRALYAAE
jgi:hypothetical protein